MGNKASLVLRPINRLFRNTQGLKALRFTVNGKKFYPLYKKEGYYVFMDLMPGIFTIEIESPGFLKETLTVAVNEGAAVGVTYVLMNPRKGFLQKNQADSVWGRVMYKGKKLEYTAFYAYITGNRYHVKIAQDTLNPGDTQVRLYINYPSYTAPAPGPFVIRDKAPKEERVYICEGLEGIYTLKQPVVYQHKRGVELHELIQGQTDGLGLFYVAFRQMPELGNCSLNICFDVGERGNYQTVPLGDGNSGDLGVLYL